MARKGSEANKAYNREYMRRKREAAKASGLVLPSDRWAKENPEKAAEIGRRYAERHPERVREKALRQAERLKALGIKRQRNEAQKAANREALRAKRAAAKAAGITLPSDTWNKANADRKRETERRWRIENADRAKETGRRKQAARRSTPWGAINNRIWPVMHSGVRSNSTRAGKYTEALGYLWADLRAHIEAQFTPEMSWSGWGSVWELDHIIPASSFKFESLDSPLFRQCWALSNLRPLLRQENVAKGSKLPEHTTG